MLMLVTDVISHQQAIFGSSCVEGLLFLSDCLSVVSLATFNMVIPNNICGGVSYYHYFHFYPMTFRGKNWSAVTLAYRIGCSGSLTLLTHVTLNTSVIKRESHGVKPLPAWSKIDIFIHRHHVNTARCWTAVSIVIISCYCSSILLKILFTSHFTRQYPVSLTKCLAGNRLPR